MNQYTIYFKDSTKNVVGNDHYFDEDNHTFQLDGVIYNDVVNVYQMYDSVDIFEITDEIFKIKDMAIDKKGYTKELFKKETELLEQYYRLRR